MDDPQPPKRRLALKPREVEPVDKVARTGDGTAISVQLIHKVNQQAADRKPGPWPGDAPQPATGELEGDPSIFRQRAVEPLDPPSAPGDEEAISVPGMLQRNHSAAIDTGPELIAMPARRRSRRHRDFMLLLVAATLAIGVLGVVFRQDTQIVALALFGIVFTTVILAWVMYGIMDKY